MPVIPIDDPADERVADYVALTDVSRRRAVEPAHGLFIAEGEPVVRRALRAGYQLRSMLLLPRHAESLGALAGTAPVYAAGSAVLAAVTGFDVHRGVLASFARPASRGAAELLADATVGRVAVLEDMANPTNVGAVFRSAAALGIDAVLLTPRCADPLYRRAVRVSMGEVFAVPWARVGEPAQAQVLLGGAGFTTLALTPDPAAERLDEVVLPPRVALLLGAEGPGLTEDWLTAADRRVRIPMAHEVDSLNVAAAAAVAFWVVGRR